MSTKKVKPDKVLRFIEYVKIRKYMLGTIILVIGLLAFGGVLAYRQVQQYINKISTLETEKKNAEEKAKTQTQTQTPSKFTTPTPTTQPKTTTPNSNTTKTVITALADITSFSSNRSSLYNTGGTYTVSWTSVNGTRADLHCTGDPYESDSTIVVPANGSWSFTRGKIYGDKIGCLLHVYNKDNKADSELITINVISPPATQLGTCSYTAGADGLGSACKIYSECMALPGGTWIGTPCGN